MVIMLNQLFLAFAGMILLLSTPIQIFAQECLDYKDYIHWYDLPGPTLPGGRQIELMGNIAGVRDDYDFYILDTSEPRSPSVMSNYGGYFGLGPFLLHGDYVFIGEPGYYGSQDRLHVLDITDPENLILAASIHQSRFSAIDISGVYLYLSQTSPPIDRLDVIHISNPIEPHPVGGLSLPGSCWDMAIREHYAYMAADDSGLLIVDILDPVTPFIALQVEIPENARAIDIEGNLLSLGDDKGGLYFFDITNPIEPVSMGFIPLGSEIEGIDLALPLASCVVEERGLHILNVQEPNNPQLLGLMDTKGYAGDVALLDELAYVVSEEYYDSNLMIVDISNPENAPIAGHLDTPGEAFSTASIDMFTLLADGSSGLLLLDLSDPGSPEILSSYELPGEALDLAVKDDIVFVAAGNAGLQILNFSDPMSPQVLGNIDTPGQAQGVAIKDDLALVADGDSGLHVVLVANPAFPVIIASLPLAGPALELVFDSDHVPLWSHVAIGSSGMVTVNLGNPENPIVVGAFDNIYGNIYGVSEVENLLYLASGNGGVDVLSETHERLYNLELPGDVRAIACDTELAYLGEDGTGLRILNLWDVMEPTVFGSAHFQVLPHAIELNGDLALLSCGEDGLYIAWKNCEAVTGLPEDLEPEAQLSKLFALPNPFNPSTEIRFELSALSHVNLSVYDTAGRKVRTLYPGTNLEAGDHRIVWDGQDDGGRALSSGVYITRLEAGDQIVSRKLTLLK